MRPSFLHIRHMENGLTQILIVEDEFMLTQVYAISLEDLGFNETQQMTYELGNVVVRFVATKDEAALVLAEGKHAAVFLDHNLRKETSEAIAPDIFRASPGCTVYLASSDPIKQAAAVTKALTDAGLAHHIPQLKEHMKSDARGFIRIMNDIIRPSAAAPGAKPSEPTV